MFSYPTVRQQRRCVTVAGCSQSRLRYSHTEPQGSRVRYSGGQPVGEQSVEREDNLNHLSNGGRSVRNLALETNEWVQ